jgi:hypothetical protein
MPDVLILANSLKQSGRCVAGIDLSTRRWVHHPEDVERGPDRWQGRVTWKPSLLVSRLAEMFDTGPQILGSREDRLTTSQISRFGPRHTSLALVRPGLVKFVQRVDQWSDRRQLRAAFEMGAQHYDLSVTDVRFSADRPPPDGDHVLTVSLAVPWQPDWSPQPLCFKIVAGIVTP